ncbi:MAG: DEAD/DEAH box helicase [Planctomycetota bacterium]|nr:DEAD/DEAH box helicase [Planctomycetota bacterium]MDA1106296.1 DEAD/DEAH box helicase [Planctomycetota bacterium]
MVAPILQALRTEGYETATPIQAQAIPPALAHRDVLGIAQTGTGKTAAFALPILQHLIERGAGGPAVSVQPGRGPARHGRSHARSNAHTKTHAMPNGRAPQALVLAPTRELAAQIGQSFTAYGAKTSIRCAVIFGGVGQGPQVNALKAGVDIVVATPGRLMDLMEQRVVDLKSISFVVLDEADRMLDMGFIIPIRRIMSALPTKRQTMLFSATMPREIQGLADSFLHDAARVQVTPSATTVERIDQRVFHVGSLQKLPLLVHVLNDGAQRTLVFTRTKHGADKVVKRLSAAGITASAIHGNKAQNHRTRALEAFRTGESPVLVATDIAARGIDVDGITHVVNFDIPVEPESYVHRIGRTARAGSSGIALSFCSQEELGLLRAIEKLTRKKIDVAAMPKVLPVVPSAAAAATAAEKGERGEGRERGVGGEREGRRERTARREREAKGGRARHATRGPVARDPSGGRGWRAEGAAPSGKSESDGRHERGGHAAPAASSHTGPAKAHRGPAMAGRGAVRRGR